jgi:hypothetical protein
MGIKTTRNFALILKQKNFWQKSAKIGVCPKKSAKLQFVLFHTN